ncbi:MAG TPA: ornithine acetyltransferase [Lentisphaeria bacterium]|nr:MAG: bifunctional ornithine acetyltransferase/N-acetylglutamate synthase [Lentisphaerae bacterium GWF2_50_93]HCE46135.1 ornithine acetyltransferase [Lentisphaeria bacterium]
MKNKGIAVIKDGGITSPSGFKSSGICAGLKRSGKADMALIYSETPAKAAAAFTSCLFAAAPVVYDRAIISKGTPVSAIIINSGNANACTGKKGLANARSMAKTTAGLLGINPDSVLVSSTGRIGVQMPMDKIDGGIRKTVSALSGKGGHDSALAIMTTDTRPKEIAVSFQISGRKVTIGGTTKGAGMIAPGMNAVPHATMLAYVTTDASIDAKLLDKLLAEGADLSFNRITVDGDMSTNDTLIILANGRSGNKIIRSGSEEAALFREALLHVLQFLAKAIVLDGEGVTKFVTIKVLNAPSLKDANLCAKSVANSLLCKTAWFGGDPNWGRVMAAAGYSGASFNPDKASLYYEKTPVVRNGQDAGTEEGVLAKIVQKKEFTITLDLKSGKASTEVWTNDISYEYVKINADYHT